MLNTFVPHTILNLYFLFFYILYKFYFILQKNYLFVKYVIIIIQTYIVGGMTMNYPQFLAQNEINKKNNIPICRIEKLSFKNNTCILKPIGITTIINVVKNIQNGKYAISNPSVLQNWLGFKYAEKIPNGYSVYYMNENNTTIRILYKDAPPEIIHKSDIYLMEAFDSVPDLSTHEKMYLRELVWNEMLANPNKILSDIIDNYLKDYIN